MPHDVTTVFCDDIRQEISGKHILVGVYGSDLVPSNLPADITLSFWVRIRGLSEGKHRFKIRVDAPTGSVTNADVEAIMSDVDVPMVMALGGFPVRISEYGDIAVWLQIDDFAESEAGRLRVSAPRKPANPKS